MSLIKIVEIHLRLQKRKRELGRVSQSRKPTIKRGAINICNMAARANLIISVALTISVTVAYIAIATVAIRLVFRRFAALIPSLGLS